jgi:hypothetical protein
MGETLSLKGPNGEDPRYQRQEKGRPWDALSEENETRNKDDFKTTLDRLGIHNTAERPLLVALVSEHDHCPLPIKL